MADEWEQYEDAPSTGKADEWEKYEAPDTAAADLGAKAGNKEGLYHMTDGSGHSLYAPYSNVRRASNSGYVMSAEDRPRFISDSASDPNIAKLFPEIKLPEGVKIAGMNTAGEPIFAPDDEPHGSARSRFWGESATPWKEFLPGMWHALTAPAQTPEEQAIMNNQKPDITRPLSGRADMIAYRMFVAPQLAEARKAKEEYQKGNWQAPLWKRTPEQRQHSYEAFMHGMGAVIPVVGPVAESARETFAKKIASGDIAGAFGSMAGQGSLYAAQELLPKGAGKMTEKLTREWPHHAVYQLIRPSTLDEAFGKDPAGAIIEQGITGSSLREIGDKVFAKANAVGAKIDEAAKDPAVAHKVVDVSSALKPLDDAIADTRGSGNNVLRAKLRRMRNRLSYEWVDDPVKDRWVPSGPRKMQMSPFQALEFKRMIGKEMGLRWSDKPLDEKVNEALKESYANVNNALNSKVPELGDLNRQYADLLGAASAIKRRAPVAERNASWSLPELVLAASGHPSAMAAALARHVARMPGVRTGAAKFMSYWPEITVPTAVKKAGAVAGVGAAQREISSDEQLKAARAASQQAQQQRAVMDEWSGYESSSDIGEPRTPPAPSAKPSPAGPAIAPIAGNAAKDAAQYTGSQSPDDIISYAVSAYGPNLDASRQQLLNNLAHAVIGQESGGNAAAVGPMTPKGPAVGMMQLMHDTALAYGVTDRKDPVQNMLGGTHLLYDRLVANNWDIGAALTDYHGHGPAGPGDEPTPAYVRDVLKRYNAIQQRAGGPQTDTASAAMPLEQAQAEAQQRNLKAPPNPPYKKYAKYLKSRSSDHWIGSDDGGQTWFDWQTGVRVQ